MTTTMLDKFGRTVIHTDQYNITLILQSEYSPSYVSLDEGILTAADAELAHLQTEEANLGDLRWCKSVNEGGNHPEVDALYRAMNDLYMAVSIRVASEILPLLDGHIAADLTAASSAAYFSRNAGCRECPCSPGVVLGSALFVDGRRIDVFVGPAL